MSKLRAEAERLKAEGVLGRSLPLEQLFDFLVTCADNDRAPKEAEIAHQVYGKSPAFDASQDAVVRVHIHRLRSKLDRFYAENPLPTGADRLTIPKGEYRLALIAVDRGRVSETIVPPSRRFGVLPIAALALAAMLAVGVLWWTNRPAPSVDEPIRQSHLWADMVAKGDRKTLLLILGDQYMFGVRSQGRDKVRLIRDENINSPEELDEHRMFNPDTAGHYVNLDLYYLPMGTGVALRSVMPIMTGRDDIRERVRVLPMSQVTPDMIRAANVIFIGHFSGLDLLREPMMAGSRLMRQARFRSLLARGDERLSGRMGDGDGNEVLKRPDYGYISTFNGPTNNRMIIIAGIGDAGLMAAAEAASSPELLADLEKQVAGKKDFEALYDVTSVRNMNMGSRLEATGPLDSASIWRTAAPIPEREESARP